MYIHRRDITAKPIESCSEDDIEALRYFSEAIMIERRRLRPKNENIEANQKQQWFSRFTPILQLPPMHIRECWCKFLKKTWSGLPGVDVYGLVGFQVQLPQDLINNLERDHVEKKAYLFKHVTGQVARFVEHVLFNGKTSYSYQKLDLLIPGFVGKLTLMPFTTNK